MSSHLIGDPYHFYSYTSTLVLVLCGVIAACPIRLFIEESVNLVGGSLRQKTLLIK